MADTIAVRVARGAALLDEREPGWWQRINLDTLNLAWGCDCVLGQLWHDKDAEDAEEAYGIALDDLALDDGKDEDFGFDKYPGPGSLSEYPLLTAAWRELIESRRAGTP